METILFLVHTETDGTLAKPALEIVTVACKLAQELQASLIAGLVGETVQMAVNQIAACGASRFLGVSGPDFSQSRYATDVAAAEAICRGIQPTLVIVPGTSRLMRVLAGVAHRLSGGVDTHVTSISFSNATLSVSRWYYRQRMEGILQRTERPWFIALDSGCHEPYRGESGEAQLEVVPVEVQDIWRRTTVTGLQAPPADEQTIRPDAELLFVAGAGWTKKQPDGNVHVVEAQRIILDFLRSSQASLGGSKSLVDQSGEGQAVLPFMTHLNQIGQTGATPRHPKGLSTCCHGEEPHVVGWRFINERRAINLDPNCGWARGKADVLYVANAFEVMEKVNSLLAQRNKSD
ncbi:MAG TPA: electron transfer flavoprotein subunit alpha [Terriglobia bacterium]|nr:electron transfer flavoprotein subunit alpha [Terriglobia bacterium]